MAMDKKIKAKWLKALRSGEYKRATGRLRRGSAEAPRGFCCLGVLADVCEIEIADGGEEVLFDGAKYDAAPSSHNLMDEGPDLPYGPVGKMIGYKATQDLMQINDASSTRGFEKQAQWIEKNL